MNLLKTAGSYLLILHNLDPSSHVNEDGIRLLRKTMESQDWQLSQELLRFFHSIDDTGEVLRAVLTETKILDPSTLPVTNGDGSIHA